MISTRTIIASILTVSPFLLVGCGGGGGNVVDGIATEILNNQRQERNQVNNRTTGGGRLNLAYVPNPGIGITTFHRYQGELPLNEFPKSTVMYFRSYWNEVEPERGQIELERIEEILSTAASSGQTVGFRVMVDGDGGTRVPQWLIDAGIKGRSYRSDEGRRAFMPDHNDPLFLSEAERLIRELGRIFDGDPRLEFVDIGIVGMTGEWHMGDSGMPLPSETNWKRIVDFHVDSFPNTQLIMLVGEVDDNGKPLAYGVSKGAGWRADCLGDRLYRRGNWNHMDSYYPDRIHNEAEVGDLWKTQPVIFETCGDPSDWAAGGATPDQFRQVLDYALEYHASLVNFRNKPIPANFWEPLNEFLRKVGYQLEPLNHSFPASVSAGSTITINGNWQNRGVAPPYKPLKLKFRLRESTNNIAQQWSSDEDLRGWLPGPVSYSERFDLSPDLSAGDYYLDVSVQWEQSPIGEMINLHSDTVRDDNWVELGQLSVN